MTIHTLHTTTAPILPVKFGEKNFQCTHLNNIYMSICRIQTRLCAPFSKMNEKIIVCCTKC